jgi:hypothetical protein
MYFGKHSWENTKYSQIKGRRIYATALAAGRMIKNDVNKMRHSVTLYRDATLLHGKITIRLQYTVYSK